MVLEKLLNTYERLKKNIYIIKRGSNKPIIIRFKDENFFHLVGLHKTNINMFVPCYITSKTKTYKYLKKNIKKFNNILMSELKERSVLQSRITSFCNIVDLLESNSITLYDLKYKVPGSVYDGDFGLMKIYEDINCLLGLKVIARENISIICAPQSWMASKKINYLIEHKKSIYMEKIISIPVELHNKQNNLTSL